MNNKRLLEREIIELKCVIDHFKMNNQVVIERYTVLFGFSYEMIISDINDKVELYNRRYGKRFGYFH